MFNKSMLFKVTNNNMELTLLLSKKGHTKFKIVQRFKKENDYRVWIDETLTTNIPDTIINTLKNERELLNSLLFSILMRVLNTKYLRERYQNFYVKMTDLHISLTPKGEIKLERYKQEPTFTFYIIPKLEKFGLPNNISKELLYTLLSMLLTEINTHLED